LASEQKESLKRGNPLPLLLRLVEKGKAQSSKTFIIFRNVNLDYVFFQMNIKIVILVQPKWKKT
jgi:hypothetical protein